MPAARQNNIRAKLEDLKGLPAGIRFDQEKTWEQLEEALLTTKPGKRAFFWLAGLSLTVFTTALIVFLQSRSTSSLFTKPQLSTKVVKQLPVLETRDKLVYSDEASAGNPVKPLKLQQTRNQNNVLQQDSSSALPMQPEIATHQQADSIPVGDTLKIASSFPAKPKYKIAHVNELYRKSTQPSNLNSAESQYLANGKQPAPELPELEGLNPKEKALILKRKKLRTALMSASQ